MKKLYILIFFVLTSVLNYGQSYHSLPESNAKWCIKFNNHVIPPPVWWYTNYWETYYSGDTTILNQQYKTIEKTEYDIFCLNTVINGPEYLGAIRDDSINKKVFYIPKGQTNEELLYDFNLVVGDTLFSYLWYQPLIVEFIDSILIQNEYHKRIIFEYPEAEIIEGIGSRTGIVEELVAFEGGSCLCALYVDTLLIYPENPCDLSGTDTCLSLNLDEINFLMSKFIIFPNPAKLHFQINISEDLLLQNPKINIISIQGNTYEKNILLSKTNKINLDHLTPGLYIVNIYINNKLILSKKITKL
ncbi:MAG: T9SS type A sorting domain-containing protein [Bacteroidales bacterium]|nr:T9SS type A sorting domain-containing protein [Bacteroidales bacterium]